jgi:heme-degrading monooxygenase HmoA
MIVTILRSRLKPDCADEYAPMAREMSELAKTVPGYVAHKGFVAEDGERLTVVEFATEAALEAWRTDPRHREAKRRGYEAFYTDFRFQICQVLRARDWALKPGQPRS